MVVAVSAGRAPLPHLAPRVPAAPEGELPAHVQADVHPSHGAAAEPGAAVALQHAKLWHFSRCGGQRRLLALGVGVYKARQSLAAGEADAARAAVLWPDGAAPHGRGV